MKKIAILILLLITIFISGCIDSGLQSKMDDIIKNDTGNSGIEVSVYAKGSTLIYNLQFVPKEKSMFDVYRVFLQFSEKTKDEKFDFVEISYKGNTKFKMAGEYFKRLGEEYSLENPINIIRIFTENLLNPDGTYAYPKRTGGLLEIDKQLGDFSDFHKKWYLNDKVKNGEIKENEIKSYDYIPEQTTASTGTLLIKYTAKTTDKLTQYIQSSDGKNIYRYSKTGMTFLIMNTQITNQGYSSINIDKFQWDLKVNTKDNPQTYIEMERVFDGEDDGVICKEALLKDNGYTTCNIAFEVPSNWDRYLLYFRESDINIKWEEVKS